MRDSRLLDLWRYLSTFRQLSELLGISQSELLEEDPCVCLIDGDVRYEISVDNEGTYLLAWCERGRREPEFHTNDVRAFVVQLILRLQLNKYVFYPGHSPYAAAPSEFALAERREHNSEGSECVTVRWEWSDGAWAEALGGTSLFEGLRWAWLFVASDSLLADTITGTGSPQLFHSYPGPRSDVPPGGLQNLTIEQWNAWRAHHLEGEAND